MGAYTAQIATEMGEVGDVDIGGALIGLDTEEGWKQRELARYRKAKGWCFHDITLYKIGGVHRVPCSGSDGPR
eukprot:12406381-Prorocentrum_lima.AAC.1